MEGRGGGIERIRHEHSCAVFVRESNKQRKEYTQKFRELSKKYTRKIAKKAKSAPRAVWRGADSWVPK